MLYGVTHTRAIYEKAIEVLSNDNARFVTSTIVYSMEGTRRVMYGFHNLIQRK